MDPGYQLTAENYEEKFHVYFTVYHEYMPDLIITVLGWSGTKQLALTASSTLFKLHKLLYLNQGTRMPFTKVQVYSIV